MIRLDDQVAIVTGGNSGIGAASAKRLANHGVKVVIAARNETRGHQIVAQITEDGGEAEFIKTDVAYEDQIEACIKATIARYGRLDIVFNNAGTAGGTSGGWGEHSDSWQAMINASLTATYQMCKRAIPYMASQGGGALINMSSILAVQNYVPGASPLGNSATLSYNVAKGSIEAYTIALAVEVGRLGVRVNCVRPGWIETPMTKAHEPRWSEVVKPYVMGRQCLKTVGHADDVASVVLFLASPAARFITGQTVAIDGGITLT